MSDLTEKILLQLNLDADQVVASLQKTKDAIELTKNQIATAQLELDKMTQAGKEGTASFKNLQDQITGYQTTLQVLNGEQRTYQSVLSQTQIANNAADGSIQQLRSELSALTVQWKNLSEEERNNADGKELITKIRTVSDELKKQESAIGDNRRNVGNYRDALTAAANNVNVFGVNLGALYQKLETAKEATLAAAAATKIGAEGTTIAADAFKLLRLAIASTGIGLLVVALAGLIEWLTKTQAGIEFVKEAFAGISAAINVVIERVIKFSSGLADIFSGNFSEGAKKMADSFTGIGNEMLAAGTAAIEFQKQLITLQKAEDAYTNQHKKNQADIAELRQKAAESDDVGTKIKLLNEAKELETKDIDQLISFAQQRADIGKKQLEELKQRGLDTEDEKNKQRELEGKADELRREKATEERGIDRQLYAAKHKDAKEAADEELRIQDELSKAKIDLIKNEREKALAQQEAAFQHQLSTIKEHSAKAGELRAAYEEANKAKITEINAKFDDQDLKHQEETDQKRLDADKRFQQEADKLAVKYAESKAAQLAAELKQVNDNTQFELAALEIAADKEKEEKINGVSKTAEQIAAIDALYTTKRLEVLKTNSDTIIAIVHKAHEEELKEEINFQKLKAEATGSRSDAITSKISELELQKQIELDANAQLYKDKNGITEKGLQAEALIKEKYIRLEALASQQSRDSEIKAIGTQLGEAANLFQKNTAAYKIFASAKAIMDTYAAADAALATGNAIFPGFGEIEAAIAIAVGLENVAKINAVQFDKGGYTGAGNPHEESLALGHKPYVYHKDEYVVPSHVLRSSFGSQMVESLEALRTATAPAFTGGYRESFAGGGFTAPNYTFVTQQNGQAVNNQYALEQALIKAAQLMPPSVVTVEDINTGQDRVNKVVNRANI